MFNCYHTDITDICKKSGILNSVDFGGIVDYRSDL